MTSNKHVQAAARRMAAYILEQMTVPGDGVVVVLVKDTGDELMVNVYASPQIDGNDDVQVAALQSICLLGESQKGSRQFLFAAVKRIFDLDQELRMTTAPEISVTHFKDGEQ